MKYNGEKIKTGITGLDKLLFGGLCLQSPNPTEVDRPLTIAIYGDKGTSKALLAMQLLHGITKSLKKYDFFVGDSKHREGGKRKVEFLPPLYYTEEKYAQNVSDMLLDMLLSKCITDIVENNAKGKQDWKGSKFSKFAFDTDNLSTGVPIKLEELDKYLGEEILVYDTHTNALHIARPLNQRHRKASENIPLFKRRHNDIKEYAEKLETEGNWSGEEYENMAQNFFDIRIISTNPQNYSKDEDIQFSICNVLRDSGYKRDEEGKTFKIPCVVIDELKSNKMTNNTTDGINDDIYDMINHYKDNSFVTIYLIDGDVKRINKSFDLLIELSKEEDEKTHYLFTKLSIKKSIMQDTAIGWHIYKKRDYGIEIYPSAHVILQKRRHMPKDLLLSQKSILIDTFQRFIDENENNDSSQNLICFDRQQSDPNYLQDKLSEKLKEFDASRQKECAVDILKAILIPSSSNQQKGESTALIGLPNTYKRFLTHSSTFNACCENRHTLNILLDKDDQIMGRMMLCPAYICKKTGKSSLNLIKDCVECYKYIHSSNIRMGCISSDEFFYYLIKQIEISRASENKISRIVVDDLQKLEYCFPVLRNDSLFLTTLISICKDYEIDLFMLCDKNSQLVGALRAQSDNVICTERVSDETLNIYIERYAGYSSPSRIWKCEVDCMKELFYCDIVNSKRQFCINERHIFSRGNYTMKNYW